MAAGVSDADRPVVVLDVNETLSDMTPIAQRFAEIGLPREAAGLWFAAVLRDGMGLTAAGAPLPFAEIARGVLGAMLATRGGEGAEAGVAHVMDGFAELPTHPDVAPGIAALAGAGHRVVTLSNGAAAVADTLLSRAGVRERVAACLSVEEAGAWKPARAAYLYAARTCGVAPAAMLMVAVHPWDLDGAARAGLRTAFLRRGGAAYPGHLTAPDLVADGLDELATVLRHDG